MKKEDKEAIIEALEDIKYSKCTECGKKFNLSERKLVFCNSHKK